MFLVAIGSWVDAEIIKAEIYRQFDEAKNENIEIVYEDYQAGGTLFISCGIKSKAYEEFKYILSNILTEVIIKYYEVRLLRKLVKENFFYLNAKEQSGVLNNACKLLKEEKLIQPGGFYKATRRNKIMRGILEYLDSEKEINIEGFVNFRLNTYINELNETVERALEIFVTEREYNEFIKLLRYFVEIQECKIDTVHLCQSKDGRYLLYDDKRNSISSEYFDELRSEILDDTINYDDLLISTLITISPNKIVIHDIEGFKNKELVQTITNVFAERITICSKCDLCSSLNESKETNKYSL
ncbi:MAG: putative sporulation protein YtxC [Clostridiaceae bacterium]|jgi:putative sporulation protein YtxC|nr:putative sporulation protein YtxC [Clostridiaceae bacterium]